jgi:TRAP-type C4-dicarboxylate transport system permease small subunit
VNSKIKQMTLIALMALMFAAVFWLIVATAVFAFRHPWATDTERLIYLPEAMRFERMKYSEMRGRDQ